MNDAKEKDVTIRDDFLGLFLCQSFTYSHNLCSLNTLDLQVQGSRHQGHRIQNDKHTRRPGGRDEGIISERFLPPRVTLNLRHCIEA